MHGNTTAYGVALLMLCVGIVGCNDGRPKRVSVAGTITIDGQPLTYGNVRFVPENDRPSYGKLDQEGRFKLTCFDGGDGAVIGPHRVQVSASEIIGGSKVRWHAPSVYADFRTSGLKVDVDEPTSDLVIELTWNGKK